MRRIVDMLREMFEPKETTSAQRMICSLDAGLTPEELQNLKDMTRQYLPGETPGSIRNPRNTQRYQPTPVVQQEEETPAIRPVIRALRNERYVSKND